MIKNNLLDICKYSNDSYLQKILGHFNNDENKKNEIKKLFNKHMEEISEMVLEDFFKKDQLTEKFIRNLHKIHFPAGYTETQKKDWVEVVCMIPWVYRSNENFLWVMAKNVKNEMKNFVDNYNYNINIVENKYDFILKTLISFLRIHPFGNWNWRVISIIIDSMLLKNNLKPIHFKKIQEEKKIDFEKMIIKSIETKNIKYIKKIIN